jgi:hypothetical protein
MKHNHPESPDYLLLDRLVRDLDEDIGAKELPLDVAVKGLDVGAVAFMARVRAGKIAAQANGTPLLAALAAAYVDGFTAGVMFQRAKNDHG